MAIDEKHIGEDFYTIISNRQTGKIAMLCNSYKLEELEQVLIRHPFVLPKVKSITRDFSALYQKLCSQLFPKAIQVGDKFHVIRNLMAAHQAIRIRYRQKELQKRRVSLKEFPIFTSRMDITEVPRGQSLRREDRKITVDIQAMRNTITSLPFIFRLPS